MLQMQNLRPYKQFSFLVDLKHFLASRTQNSDRSNIFRVHSNGSVTMFPRFARPKLSHLQHFVPQQNYCELNTNDLAPWNS